MNTTFIEEMKTQLEEERASLTKELSTIASPDIGDHVPGSHAPTFPNYGDDNMGENSESPSEVSDYTVNVSVTGSLETKLAEVNAALERLTAGTFGTCVKCGGDIGEDRLRANPSADMCMNCARAHQ